MKGSFLLSALAVIVIGFFIISSGSGCANMAPPTGGPRDSLPPVITKLDPRDSARLFNEKKFTISFNEFVQIDELQKNLIVSPTPKVSPIVVVKLRDVIVTIKDTLEPNTTYSFDFGNAIQDLNEGNIFKDFRYIFSTGTTIDTLALGGRVLVAETGKPDSTLVVMLHRSTDDSAVIKDRPRYVARLDSAGYFTFRNVAEGEYRLYALKDENNSRKFLSKEQLFAFSDSSVNPRDEKNDYLLYAFLEKDTATKKFGSSLPVVEKKPVRPAQDTILKFQTNNEGASFDLLQNFEFDFSPEPIKTFDSTKVVLTDENYRPVRGYKFQRDTSNKKMAIVYPWAEGTKYNVLVDSLFAEDTAGRKVMTVDTITFITRKNSEYGLVRIRFLGLSLADNPLLQFIQGDEVRVSHKFTNNTFYARLFKPGEYEMRIVSDRNQNGVWDTGQFFREHRQPEKVRRISRKINVKANWDNEIDIQM